MTMLNTILDQIVPVKGVSKEVIEEAEKVQGGVGTEVVVRLDTVTLYPSITKKIAMEVCKIAAEESVVKVKDINLLDATRLLMLTWTDERAKESEIRRYLPVRRRIPGRRIGTVELQLNSVPSGEEGACGGLL